jgi:hypothetical protein
MGGVAAIVRSTPQIFKKVNTPAPVSPTAPEVSQSTATAMDGYDARKTKAKGRSTTILTGPKGVEEETLTLGKRSLLGQ